MLHRSATVRIRVSSPPTPCDCMLTCPCLVEISIRKYLGNSISMVSLISENLLCHPFVVLRRQCQVHHNSARFHLVPVTLMPIVYQIQRRQGITTLWKGIGSTFLVRAMSLGVEDLISKVTPWPKELHPHTTKKHFAQHLFLKW